MQGPNSINSPRTIGSIFRKKKKSSPCGPYFPGTFHCMGTTQTHALHRIQIRPNDLPDRLLPQVGESLCLHHCEASFHQLGPSLSHRPSAVRFCNALRGFVQCRNWVFEVLFPQFQSRSISSQNVVFAFSCRLIFQRDFAF